MAKAQADIPLTAFERFVQKIAAVPKAKVDELEAAERAKASPIKRGPNRTAK